MSVISAQEERKMQAVSAVAVVIRMVVFMIFILSIFDVLFWRVVDTRLGKN
jgi:preprotein translocase subunit SecE